MPPGFVVVFLFVATAIACFNHEEFGLICLLGVQHPNVLVGRTWNKVVTPFSPASTHNSGSTSSSTADYCSRDRVAVLEKYLNEGRTIQPHFSCADPTTQKSFQNKPAQIKISFLECGPAHREMREESGYKFQLQ